LSSNRRFFDQVWLLLMLPPLFWASNAIVGRTVAGAVPPVGLAFWRWTLGALLVLPFAWRHLPGDTGVLRRHWKIISLLAMLGIGVFNTFVYIGLNSTSVLNSVMMQSGIPPLIVLMTFLLFRDKVSKVQGFGIALSLVGAMTLISKGDIGALARLELNPGDLWIFAAVICYAGYTALMRQRPAVHPFSFLFVTFALGAAMILPFYLAETWNGHPFQPTLLAVGATVYVALFPSILAYLCFNRLVAVAGPNRAGLCIHLVPVFGSLAAILFLGETLHLFHIAGIALIATGIWLATRTAASLR
jgi:drug/metabolite transporter (DMT)-like permease